MEIKLNTFKKLFDTLSHRNSHAQVFRDFLDAVICALSGQRMEAQYLDIIKQYEKKEIDLFAALFGEMVNLMDGDGSGYVDALGEFFMQEITYGKNGQFFTPPHVCDMMALMSGEQETFNKTICDPSCGSGRMLLSYAKAYGKMNWFYAADLDENCAKMTAINFCLNGLRGEVAHMNSLSLDLYKVYQIYFDPEREFVPTIRIMENENSVFYTNPEIRKEVVVQAERKKQNGTKQQFNLFEFSELSLQE